MDELVVIGVRILEALFFGGFIGAAIVILLAGMEDVHSIFEHEPTEQQH